MEPAISIDDVLELFAFGLNLFGRTSMDKCNVGYGGWLYENQLLRRLKRLETQKCLSREGKQGAWVYRVTEIGRSRAIGKRDPEACWNRKWDGRWRQIIFDLPVEKQRERVGLLRWLRRNDFGYLQDSVWIRPDPANEMAEFLGSLGEDASSVILLECRCVNGFSDSSLVQSAWPFDLINKAYQNYQQLAGDAIQRLKRNRLHPRELFALMRTERKVWRRANEQDPLLPSPLCPSGYQGKSAWENRKRLLKLIGSHLANK